jgi:leader peptidase (prepilin peptidase) / N-methyltransferase
MDLGGSLLVALCAVLGLAFGSFANVAIQRWPKREKLTSPRSQCPHCEAPIRAGDNIPLVSFVLLRGKCRNCGESISFRYPVVELLVAVIWALLAVIHGPVWVLPAMLLLAWALVVATFIDLEHTIIPNALTFRLPPILLVLLLVAGLFDWAWADFGRAVLLGIVLPVGMLILSELFRVVRGLPGMGMGDIKLGVSIGLVLGYLGGWYVIVALYATIMAAAVVAIALMAWGRAAIADRIPFGPYLALGTLIVLFAGDPLVEISRNLVGF